MIWAGQPVCVCEHIREGHEHYRPGSDCASCGCGRYRRRGWIRRALGATRGTG